MSVCRAPVLFLALVFALPAAGQSSKIVTDGSLPGRSRTDLTATQSGPHYEIGEDLGVQVGSNLFHSLAFLDVAISQSATFTDDPAINPATPVITNVIARVTEGPSQINGLLRSTVQDADLFLINPSGVIFGGGSTIDVPASFTVTTAHTLIYEGGERLETTVAESPVLRPYDPVAFGFLESVPSADIVFGNPDPNRSRVIRVPEGETFTAIAGNVTVKDNVDIFAFGGDIQLAATGTAVVDVPRDVGDWQVPPGTAPEAGEIRMENRSSLDTVPFDPSIPQGRVVIRGGRFVAVDRVLVRAGEAGENGTAIDVAVSDSISLTTLSELRSESQGARRGGDLRVSARNVALADRSTLRARVFENAPGSAAPAGDVVIRAQEAFDASGGSLIETTTFGSSRAGSVAIDVGSLTLDGSRIVAQSDGSGAAGGIEIDVDARLQISSGSIEAITSQAPVASEEQIGGIRIAAGDVEVRGGAALILASNRLADGSNPVGGGIQILARDGVRVTDGGVIATESTTMSPGGDIRVESSSIEVSGGGLDGTGRLRPATIQAGALAGDGGSIELIAANVEIAGEAGKAAGIVQAFVAPGATGAGGDILVTADLLELRDGGQISTTTNGEGDAGAIRIGPSGGTVRLRGDAVSGGIITPSGVFSRSETDADGGDIVIESARIEILDGATISARARGVGRSGSVSLTAGERILVAGSGLGDTVISARGVDGPGGDLTLDAPLVEVLDGASADVSTNGAGAGGILSVAADVVRVEGVAPSGQRAALAAQADGRGNAGGVVITAEEHVRIGAGGEVTALSAGLGGSPGDITIAAPVIEIDGGVVTAEAASGTGGNVTLTAERSVTLAEGAEVTARSARGDAGSVTVESPVFTMRESAITTDADGFGGSVFVREADRVVLEDAEIVAISRGNPPADSGGGDGEGSVSAQAVAAAEATSAGGNVTITGGAVVLNQARIVADGFGNANGGIIDITADPWLRSGDSTITASSEFGLDGVVDINTPYGEITGDLVALPENFLDASSELAEPCLARDAPSGSFTVRQTSGRVLAPPDAPLPAEGEDAPQCEAP